MPERRYVYRLVVDYWPTPDGKPFADQPLNWWEVVAACATGNHADPDCGCPAWLPRELTNYLPRPAGFDYPSYLDPPKYTRRIGDDGETPDYATGYPGAPGYDVIAVPVAPTRRFMQHSGPAAMAKQLREWGCRAHVERAEVGEWEVVKTHA